MKIKDLKRIRATIEQHRKGIAKHRDALREIIDEATQLEECADDATNGLSEALHAIDCSADDLSKFA